MMIRNRMNSVELVCRSVAVGSLHAGCWEPVFRMRVNSVGELGCHAVETGSLLVGLWKAVLRTWMNLVELECHAAVESGSLHADLCVASVS